MLSKIISSSSMELLLFYPQYIEATVLFKFSLPCPSMQLHTGNVRTKPLLINMNPYLTLNLANLDLHYRARPDLPDSAEPKIALPSNTRTAEPNRVNMKSLPYQKSPDSHRAKARRVMPRQ